jgi:WD40 repeat protein
VDEVFISYSRVDSSFVRNLDRGLREAGKDVWVDWEDIPPSADWMAEIGAAVEGASAFVFVLTASSAKSQVCARELEMALADNKRIIPVELGTMDPSLAPPELARLNWVHFDGEEEEGEAFEASLAKLLSAIDTDLEWVAAHTHWLGRAHNWERRGRDTSLLLRGSDLREAENFLASQREGVEPAPTELQREFVLASRRASGRRQRILLGTVATGMVIAIALAIFALIQRNEANDQKHQAQSQALSARADQAATANPVLSAQLAREAVEISATPEAVASLRAAVARLGYDERLAGHADHVNDVSFSSDGSQIATASSDGTVRIWAAADGSQIAAIADADEDPVNHAVFSADDKTILISGSHGLVGTYDAESGEELRRFEAGNELALTAEFSPDGTLVAAGGADGRVRVFDADTGKPLGDKSIGGAIYAARFSPDGQSIVIAGDPSDAYIWDLRSGTTKPLRHPDGSLYNASFSPDGAQVATASADGKARLFEVADGELVQTLDVDPGGAYSAEFSPDAKQLVTTGFDRRAHVWDLKTGKEVQTLSGHSDVVVDAAFSPDGSTIATGSDDHTAFLYSVGGEAPAASLTGTNGAILALAFTPDGSRIVTGGVDQVARIYPSDGGAAQVVRTGNGVVQSIDVDEAGDFVAAPQRSNAGVFSLEADRVGELSGPDAVVRAAAISSDGDVIATAGDARRAGVWDAKTGDQLQSLSGHTRPVYAAAITGDGSVVATGGVDRTVRLWDAETGEPTGELRGHTGSIESLAFSADGHRLVSASDDGTARVWDVASGDGVAVLRGHDGAVYSARFSADGERVVTGGEDATARVWDVATASEIESIPQPGQLYAVDFGPADRLAMAGEDGVARVYDCGLACAPSDELLETVDRLAGSLSDADRDQALGL